MPQKIIYTGKSAQIYRLKESESSTRFLNLRAYLSNLLVQENGAVLLKEGRNFDIFHYKNTALKASYSKQGDKIILNGARSQISVLEKSLAKRLKKARARFGEMYDIQPFKQNEILQKKLMEAIRTRALESFYQRQEHLIN